MFCTSLHLVMDASPDVCLGGKEGNGNLYQNLRYSPLGRRLQFVATVHNDHTGLRHVHGFFLLQGRVSREEFRLLREIAYQAATREARFQRSGRDRVRDNPRYRALHRYHALTQSVSARQSVSVRRRGRSVRPLNLQPGCLSCGYGQVFGIPSSRIFCPKCSVRLTRDRTGGLRL